MKSLLAAVAITAAMMTHAWADGHQCPRADAIVPQLTAAGLEALDMPDIRFRQWLASAIAKWGAPPSGRVPDSAVIMYRPGAFDRVTVILILPDGTTCDQLNLMGASAREVLSLARSTAI